MDMTIKRRLLVIIDAISFQAVDVWKAALKFKSAADNFMLKKKAVVFSLTSFYTSHLLVKLRSQMLKK